MGEGGTGAMHGEGREKRGRSQSDEWEEGGRKRHCKERVREREHEGRRMDPSHSSSNDERGGNYVPPWVKDEMGRLEGMGEWDERWGREEREVER